MDKGQEKMSTCTNCGAKIDGDLDVHNLYCGGGGSRNAFGDSELEKVCIP